MNLINEKIDCLNNELKKIKVLKEILENTVF